MAADLKRVKKIPLRSKHIVYGWIKQIQNIFSSDHDPYFIINQLIQDLCLLYYTQVIDTKVLTDNEQMKLLNMVNQQLNHKYNGEWKLLFRKSRDGKSRNNFYDKCDGKTDTICIIESEQGNVFGAFTSKKFDKSRADGINHHQEYAQYEDDPLAFVYRIRSIDNAKSAQIWPVKNNGKLAIQHYSDGYLSWGYCGKAMFIEDHTVGIHISDDSDYGIDGEVCWQDCEQYDLKRNELNGEDSTYNPTEIEVFQILTLNLE